MTEFAIYRILGNELAPRDKPGTRREVLRFILENESDFTDTRKLYVLNTIWDAAYMGQLAALLDDRGARYVLLSCDWTRYRQAADRRQRICAAININAARNFAVEHGRQRARFTVVLDGDCYFCAEGWKSVVAGIEADRGRHAYYSVPSRRTSLAAPETPLCDRVTEPMLVFRNDAPLRFDPTIPFGEAEKLELLYRLGHSRDHDRSCLVERHGLCHSVGFVWHVATGDEDLERDVHRRIEARDRSIDRLLSQLDGMQGENLRT
jgi:hypothetical protein